MVRDITLSVASSTSIVLSWTPPPDPLPGWNISYYYTTYRALDPRQDNRLITTFTDRVKDGRTSETISADKLLVDVDEVVHEFEVVAALKIEGLEGIGEVKGETAMINASLTTDEALFQVMLGPVPYCVDWEFGKSDSIQETLHKALQEGIRSYCNCSLERSPISRGIFSCRGSKNVVTYRSTVKSLNSTEIVGYIQDWVGSNVTILHDWYLVDIFSSCSTKVEKLDEPECNIHIV